jgi:Mitosis protein DIM1
LRHLSGGHHGGAGLQQDVRAVRPLHHHVLLPQQAHHDMNFYVQVKNFCVIYLVDITEVPDFNKMYELYDPCTIMFFFRNKHIMIDLGTGNNNKINWAMEDKQVSILVFLFCTYALCGHSIFVLLLRDRF